MNIPTLFERGKAFNEALRAQKAILDENPEAGPNWDLIKEALYLACWIEPLSVSYGHALREIEKAKADYRWSTQAGREAVAEVAKVAQAQIDALKATLNEKE